MAVDSYLDQRVEQYRAWYDKRARRCKAWHLRLRVTGLVAGVAAPVLVNVPGVLAQVGATVTALTVVLTLALEAVLHLREQWRNYRYTEQYLDKERFLFMTAAGPYRGMAPEHAFARFVERVESAIASENSTTLATLSLSPEIRVNGGTP
jgi:Protein of unknown function (DUF4231)